ncbi:MAG: hypothetical protein ACHQX1_01720 [Candidatus Micrarchaeales archaeon]
MPDQIIIELPKIKSQSAIEYLTTYGWAIIIIAVVLLALFNLGLFNPSSFVSTTCVFPAEFQCLSAVLTGSTGSLNLTLQQATQSNINVTSIGCNNQGTISNMVTMNNPPSNQIQLSIGGANSFLVTCYQNGTVVNINPGQIYRGYVLVNYTSLTTGFPHTAEGSVVAKAV